MHADQVCYEAFRREETIDHISSSVQTFFFLRRAFASSRPSVSLSASSREVSLISLLRCFFFFLLSCVPLHAQMDKWTCIHRHTYTKTRYIQVHGCVLFLSLSCSPFFSSLSSSILASLLPVPSALFADIESDFGPIVSMYNLLDRYLPNNISLIDKDEQDQRLMLRSSWTRLLEEAQTCQDHLIGMQNDYKKELISNINSFKVDTKQFREDFEKNGPSAPGVTPR